MQLLSRYAGTDVTIGAKDSHTSENMNMTFAVILPEWCAFCAQSTYRREEFCGMDEAEEQSILPTFSSDRHRGAGRLSNSITQNSHQKWIRELVLASTQNISTANHARFHSLAPYILYRAN